MFTLGIITVSDRSSQGKRDDSSGLVIESCLSNYPVKLVSYVVVPDELEEIEDALLKMVDQERVDLIFTTGGTGFSPRDITPEATKKVVEREVPGIPEAMRAMGMQITKRAMLSRAVAGIRKNSLIVNLPGSPKAVRENLSFVLPDIFHGLEVLKGRIVDC
jgi:molybdopterin adenylyltransferase